MPKLFQFQVVNNYMYVNCEHSLRFLILVNLPDILVYVGVLTRTTTIRLTQVSLKPFNITLLLGSMYSCSWLIQLNTSYKYNGKFGCTGISILNGHISKPVALCEKLKKMNCNYFSILDRWFRNFPQCICCHFWLICGHFRSFLE